MISVYEMFWVGYDMSSKCILLIYGCINYTYCQIHCRHSSSYRMLIVPVGSVVETAVETVGVHVDSVDSDA